MPSGNRSGRAGKVTSSPLDSSLLGNLVADARTAGCFSDEAAVRAMLEFEVALATVQERLGVIPAGSAAQIGSAAEAFEPDWAGLITSMPLSGHPVAELVRELREAAGPAGQYVHCGATAQDVMDTALVTRLSRVLRMLDYRLELLIDALADQADRHRKTVMAGRTRTQQAVPITFGLKAAGWLLPLVRHRHRLAELWPRVMTVQFGGAAGTLGTLRGKGLVVMEELARELGLHAPATPWHSQRDGFAELAGWLSLLTGSLGKMGQDLALLAQTEIAEASDGSAGSSSAMPHKSNPIKSEVLVTIGRANATLLASMHQAAIHEHERGGSAWTLEWLTLPQMAMFAGGALRTALDVLTGLEIDPDRMARNVASSSGTILAEAAKMVLAAAIPLEEADQRVKNASRQARLTGTDLIEILQRDGPADVDWAALQEPGQWLGSAEAFVDRAIATARAGPAPAELGSDPAQTDSEEFRLIDS